MAKCIESRITGQDGFIQMRCLWCEDNLLSVYPFGDMKTGPTWLDAHAHRGQMGMAWPTDPRP